jgi:hypothetical protein
MGSLSSTPHIKAKILCFCVRLFDLVVELHTMDEKKVNDFLIGKWKWLLYVKGLFHDDIYIFVLSGGILFDN